MKLIFGLLALFNAVKLAQSVGAIPTNPHAHIIFPDGFKDGFHLTFLYINKNISDRNIINFYDTETPSNDYMKNNLLAHITISPEGKNVVITDTCTTKQGCWSEEKKRRSTIKVIDSLKEAVWWRVDVYKIDDYHLSIGVQGFWSGVVHDFPESLSAIKSAYIFNNVDAENVFIKCRYPDKQLIDPMDLSFFDGLLNKTMRVPEVQTTTTTTESPSTTTSKETSVNSTSGSTTTNQSLVPTTEPTTTPPPTEPPVVIPEKTSFGQVSIGKFPVGKKLYLTVWLGAHSKNKQGNAMIQFLRNGYDPKAWSELGVLTIYQEWVGTGGGRNSFVGWFDKIAGQAEKVREHTTVVKCVEDGSAGDIVHYRIERVKEEQFKVLTYYSGEGLNPLEGNVGKICTSANRNPNREPNLMNLDKDIEIRGLNGATILHVEKEW